MPGIRARIVRRLFTTGLGDPAGHLLLPPVRERIVSLIVPAAAELSAMRLERKILTRVGSNRERRLQWPETPVPKKMLQSC
jgi:hypothetical protein